MKAKVKASDICRACKLAINTLDPKDSIRSNIVINAINDTLTIKATNSQFSIITTIPAEVEEAGVAVVDGKMVYNVLAKSSGECVLSANENIFTIKSNGRTKIPNVKREISMIEYVDGKNVTCDAVAFQSAVNKVSYAIDENQQRVILTGAHVVAKDGFMTFTGLDGFRLAQTVISCAGDDIDVVIPIRVLSMICDASTGETLSFHSNGIHLTVEGDGFVINAIMLSGTYVETVRLIPTKFATDALIKTSDMRNVLDSATVASGSSNLVKLHIASDKIEVTSNSQEADFNGEASAIVHGDTLSIAFNLKYLISAFNHIDSEQCEMHFNEPANPVIISPHNSEEQTDIHLILPVRTFT